MKRVESLLGAITLVALAAVGCSDADQAGPAGPSAERTGGGPANAKANAEKAEWSGYAVDVETVLRLRGAKPVTYRSHLERKLDTNDHWLTRVTLAPRRALSADAQAGELVASVEMSDDGNVTGVFDREGRAMPATNFLDGTLPRGSATRSLESIPPLPAQRGRAGVKSDRHAWLDDAVVTPEAADRIAQRLAKHMVRQGDTKGAKRFVRAGAVTAETLVDGTTGGVIEENAYRGQKRLFHATHSYSRLASGTLVRTHSRVEYAPDDDGEAVVVERKLTNIKLTPGGNEP